MKRIKKIICLSMVMIMMFAFTGCGIIKPYDTPEIYNIEASQTAFLITLTGDSNEQAAFQSEAMLAQAKIAAKEVQIPHRWVQTGRWPADGKWIPTAKLIVVERKPVTREWSSGSESGTSNRNQAIFAESSESIGFSVAMNCTAQIYSEEDAVKFLYSYNNVPLDTVMDNEIRPRIETSWNELCTSLGMEEIRVSKAELMAKLRDEVIPYFEKKGITITTLGLKEGFTYENDSIQKAIDDQIVAEKGLVTAQNNAKVAKEKADADAAVKIKNAEAEAQALKIQAEAEAEANKKRSSALTPEILEMERINAIRETWKGDVPQVMGAENSIMGLDLTTGEVTK